MNVSAYQTSVMPSSASPTAASGGLTGMGSDEFMQLLLAEMKNQNPLDPVQDKDMMAQITQINSVVSMNKVSASVQELTLSNQMIQAANLIGKDVSYAASDGTTQSGVVSGVTYQGTQIDLTVGQAQVALTQLKGVQLDAGIKLASNG